MNPDSPVPCEVYDRKFRDGVPQLIYSAQFDHAYCVSKAAEFVERLRKGFWVCEAETLIAESETVAVAPAAAAVPTEPAPTITEADATGETDESAARAPATDSMSAAIAEDKVASTPTAGRDEMAAGVGSDVPASRRPSAKFNLDAVKAYLATTSQYRFAAEDLGDDVFVDAVDVVEHDVNGDGTSEIFVRLNHERYHVPTACPVWDLYTVSEWEFDDENGIALEEDLAAGMGICDVIALDSRTSGFEDLLIRVNSIDGSLSVKLIKFYFGGYRVMEHHTYDADAGTTRIIRTTVEGNTSDDTENGKSGLITLFESGVPLT